MRPWPVPRSAAGIGPHDDGATDASATTVPPLLLPPLLPLLAPLALPPLLVAPAAPELPPLADAAGSGAFVLAATAAVARRGDRAAARPRRGGRGRRERERERSEGSRSRRSGVHAVEFTAYVGVGELAALGSAHAFLDMEPSPRPSLREVVQACRAVVHPALLGGACRRNDRPSLRRIHAIHRGRRRPRLLRRRA